MPVSYTHLDVYKRQEQSADPIFYIDPSGEKSMIIWMLNFQIDTEEDRWIPTACNSYKYGKSR